MALRVGQQASTEAGKQILQVTLKDNLPMEKCSSLIIQIAGEYENGQVSATELYRRRDELLGENNKEPKQTTSRIKLGCGRRGRSCSARFRWPMRGACIVDRSSTETQRAAAKHKAK